MCEAKGRTWVGSCVQRVVARLLGKAWDMCWIRARVESDGMFAVN